jgi:hypothetical protein
MKTTNQLADGITIFSTSLGLDLIHRFNGNQQRKLHLKPESQGIKLADGTEFQLIVDKKKRKLQARLADGTLLTFMSYSDNSRFFTYMQPMQKSEPAPLF